jgi:ABC-2 type transport system ATP-binding protein
MMMENYLEIKNLSKTYGNFLLDNISFALPAGYIMGLIGANGAGKTTTIKLILNMLTRQSGQITVFGLDNMKDERRIKESIGVVFDTVFFADGWNMSDVEKNMGMFYEQWDKSKYFSYLDKFQINKTKKIKELSRGMQMKLMLACAFSHDAKLLILDEPTSGLDPVSRDDLLELLLSYIEDGQHSVLFSTHITTDLDRIADYITFLHEGSLIFTGEKSTLLDTFRIVKGGKNELDNDLKKHLVGLREYSTGFEGLINTKYIPSTDKLTVEPITIDNIVVYTSKGGNLE